MPLLNKNLVLSLTFMRNRKSFSLKQIDDYVINLIMEFEERATTAIYIRVKRFEETYFILCDEYETVESLKGRLLVVL